MMQRRWERVGLMALQTSLFVEGDAMLETSGKREKVDGDRKVGIFR
jgi:hypothetical protein